VSLKLQVDIILVLGSSTIAPKIERIMFRIDRTPVLACITAKLVRKCTRAHILGIERTRACTVWQAPFDNFDVNPAKNNEAQQRKGTQDRSMDRFEWNTSTRCL
jgi:hypothetical protein